MVMISPKSFLHSRITSSCPQTGPWLPKLAKEPGAEHRGGSRARGWVFVPPSATPTSGVGQHPQGEPASAEVCHLLKETFVRFRRSALNYGPLKMEQNLLETSARSFGGGYVKMPLVSEISHTSERCEVYQGSSQLPASHCRRLDGATTFPVKAQMPSEPTADLLSCLLTQHPQEESALLRLRLF